MKLFIVGGRYGYYAIDLVDTKEHAKHGGIEKTVAVKLTRKMAHQMAYNLNEAYAQGYYDATGDWPVLTPQEKKDFDWFLKDQRKYI